MPVYGGRESFTSFVSVSLSRSVSVSLATKPGEYRFNVQSHFIIHWPAVLTLVVGHEGKETDGPGELQEEGVPKEAPGADAHYNI